MFRTQSRHHTQRFSLLLLDEGEYYFEDHRAVRHLGSEASEPGVLRLCSHGVIFDPEDAAQPLVKLRFANVSALVEVKEHKDLGRDAGGAEEPEPEPEEAAADGPEEPEQEPAPPVESDSLWAQLAEDNAEEEEGGAAGKGRRGLRGMGKGMGKGMKAMGKGLDLGLGAARGGLGAVTDGLDMAKDGVGAATDRARVRHKRPPTHRPVHRLTFGCRGFSGDGGFGGGRRQGDCGPRCGCDQRRERQRDQRWRGQGLWRWAQGGQGRARCYDVRRCSRGLSSQRSGGYDRRDGSGGADGHLVRAGGRHDDGERGEDGRRR